MLCDIYTMHLPDRVRHLSLKRSEMLAVFSVFYALSWYFNFNICRIQRNMGPESFIYSPEFSNLVKVPDGSRTLLHPKLHIPPHFCSLNQSPGLLPA